MADAEVAQTESTEEAPQEAQAPEQDAGPDSVANGSDWDIGTSDSLDDILALHAESESKKKTPKKTKSEEQELIEADAAGEDDVEDEDEEDEEPKQALSDKASKRFQSLSKRTKAAEERSQKMEEQLRVATTRATEQAQEYRQYIQQLSQQMDHARQEQTQQMASLKQQWDAQAEAKKFETMSPEEQFRARLAQDNEKLFEQRLQKALSPLQQRLEAQETERKQALNNVRKQQEYDAWSQETTKTASRILDGFKPERMEKLSPLTEELLVNIAAVYRLPSPAAAETQFRRFLDEYWVARTEASAEKARALRDKNNAAPRASGRTAVAGGTQTASSSSREPTNAELARDPRFTGLMGRYDWHKAGRPALTK